MHFQTFTGNSSGPTALLFFVLLSAFFTSSLLTQFTSSSTTFASSVLGFLLFYSFISFSKYSFHLFDTASEITITLPFSSVITLTYCTSFAALFLRHVNLYNSFSLSFVSNLAYKSSYARLFAITTDIFALFFISLYIFLPFSSLILSHAFFASFFFFMLFCTSSFYHHVSLFPFRFPNVTPSTVLFVFLNMFAVLFHSSGNPFSPPKILVTSYLNTS